MKTDKSALTDSPSVAILLSVYDANPAWLSQLLTSLNRQTYPNLCLWVYDDCPDKPLDETVLERLITAFPYRLIRGENNLGSNLAFERLSAEAEATYFSYCDQDDVWHADKIARMVEVLEQTGSPLVCSDMRIIDAESNCTANSITAIRRRHVFYEGENLAPSLLIKNFVVGCAMLIRSDVVKGALPFAKTLVHDQWLAIHAALSGKIEVIKEPLLDYRQHGHNQTGILSGITDKESYYQERIVKYRERIEELKTRFASVESLQKPLEELTLFYQARDRYYHKASKADAAIMRRYRDYAGPSVKLELVMRFLPNRVFGMLIKRIQGGKL